MIITRESVSQVHGRVAMVDGSFDPLHDGHIEYFRRAAEMWSPLLCNIAPDSWTEKKHPVLLQREKRAVVIDAIKFVDYVLVLDSPTVEVLELVRPRFYIKGRDWEDRGGVPQAERQVCDKLEIQIVYLDTVRNSSSKLIQNVQGTSQS
jgi:cytidyltransferase-like protein